MPIPAGQRERRGLRDRPRRQVPDSAARLRDRKTGVMARFIRASHSGKVEKIGAITEWVPRTRRGMTATGPRSTLFFPSERWDPDDRRAVRAITWAPTCVGEERILVSEAAYIRKTPNLVSSTGAFRHAESARLTTRRVSSGAMTPSSQSRAVA